MHLGDKLLVDHIMNYHSFAYYFLIKQSASSDFIFYMMVVYKIHILIYEICVS